MFHKIYIDIMPINFVLYSSVTFTIPQKAQVRKDKAVNIIIL